MEAQGYLRVVSKNDAYSKKYDAELQLLRQTVEEMKKMLSLMQNDDKSRNQDTKSQRNSTASKTYNNRKSHNKNGNKSNIKCHECGETGHVKYKCPNRDTQTSNNSPAGNAKNSHNVSTSSNHGAGLFVRANISGIPVLSTMVFNRMMNPISLNAFKSKITTASGTPLEIRGKTQISLEINEQLAATEVIVAGINVDAIIGLDFMKAHDIQIDVINDTMTMRGEVIKLNCTGSIGCYRVVVTDQRQRS
jgi:hypothetical protein